VTGGFGFSHYDDSRGLDNAVTWSIGGGYRFDNPFAIELGYLAAEPAGTNVDVDVEIDQWRVDGLYHFARDSGYISPFLSFGVGNGTFDHTTGEVDETLTNVGVGAKVFLSEAMAFRTDLKMFRGSNTDDNDLTLIFSLHYAVGGLVGSRSESAATVRPAKDMKEPEVTTVADADGDGVADDADRCGGTPAAVAVDTDGCPRDRDGDGVADYEDACPGTSDAGARIDERGCYEVLEETRTVELDVKFDVDSAETRPDHRAEVAEIHRFMTEYPQTRVTIEGHTDDTGAADYNEDLSQRRADAIAQMLIVDFDIDADRVSAIGYGEERPVATNETTEGRQQNRRVVAVVEATVKRVRTSEAY